MEDYRKKPEIEKLFRLKDSNLPHSYKRHDSICELVCETLHDAKSILPCSVSLDDEAGVKANAVASAKPALFHKLESGVLYHCYLSKPVIDDTNYTHILDVVQKLLPDEKELIKESGLQDNDTQAHNEFTLLYRWTQNYMRKIKSKFAQRGSFCVYTRKGEKKKVKR